MSTPFQNKLISTVANPFLNDYTEQLEKVSQGLTKLFEIEANGKPLVVTLDAPWGIGKTTFIDMWGQSLLNQKKLAIKFDAWKSDYTDYPLMALIIQLTSQLESQGVKKAQIKKITETGKKLCAALLPGLAKFGVNWGLSIIKADGAFEQFIKDMYESLQDNIDQQINEEFSSYETKVNTLNDFKQLLKSIAKEKVIFLFIDELDRCKPSFAINTLEVIKHIFDIDNICCILSTNVSSLAKVISKNYGYDIDEAKEYLERFYDIPIKLPDPDKKKYLEQRVRSIDSISNAATQSNILIEIMQICCDSAKLSLRVIDKYIRDIRIFIECNESNGANRTLPNVYLPCAAYEIALRRVSRSNLISDIKSSLAKNSYFKLLNNIFLASKNPDDLNKAIENFYSDFSSLTTRTSLSKDDHKSLDTYGVIENTIIKGLYGGLKKISYRSQNEPAHAVRQYNNHFQMATKVIEFLDLIPTETSEEDIKNK